MIDCDWAVHVTVLVQNKEASFNLYANTEQRAHVICECARIAARSGCIIEVPPWGQLFVVRATDPYRL